MKFKSVCLMTALLLASLPAVAQNFGELAGTVADPSGAVIAGASITITNEASGITRTAETNEAGSYNVPFLNPGTYTVAAALDGFNTSRIAGVIVQIGDVLRNDFTLEIGVVTEIVEVEAGAQMLQTSNTSVGTVIDNERIVELPINGRNYLNLVKLSPNVSAEMQSGGQANSRQGGERANQSISIAGQRQQYNRYTLDGVENTDPNFNTFIIRPSVDALQEFKVQTGVYSAEYGKGSSQVIVTTKSGTNEFHGTVYEFLRNDKIQARTWGRHGDKTPFRRNQFGTTVTGPIVKNRIFFMANYEGLRQSVQGFGQATTAPASLRAGDFSDSANIGDIYDPTSIRETSPGNFTATQYTNNMIPTSQLSPISQQLLEFYPEPNQAVAVGEGRNYVRNTPEILDWDQFTARGDFVESASSQWFFRYSWGGETVGDGRTFEAQDERITTDVQQYVLSNTRTFSPTLVNEFRLGVSLFDNDKLTRYNFERNVSAELAIPGMPVPVEAAWGTPSIGMGGNNNEIGGWGEASGGPFLNNNRNYQLINNTSWISGNHTFKFGIDIAESRYAQIGNQFARGQFAGNNQQTADPNNIENTGTAFASFMAGALSAATRAGGLPNVQFRRKPVMLYFEDTWRITSKLTMNIGLRYENTKPWHDKHSGYNNILFHGCNGVNDQGIDLDCQTPTQVRPGSATSQFEGLDFHLADTVPVAVSDDLLYSRSMVRWDTNDYAPRLGISYAPDAKTTVRFGYGIFYSQDTANPVFDMGRNFGARDTADGADSIPDVFFEDPWAKQAGGNCSDWDGACFQKLYTFGNDPERITPNIQQWVLNIQRQVTDTLMFEVGYMGSVGHNLQTMHGYNEATLRSGPDDLTSQTTRRPFGDVYNRIQTVDSMANSNYHGLGVKLLQRSNNGLTYLIGYTWAKSIDDASAIRTNGGDNLFPANNYDWSSERSLSQFHTSHRLTASVLYDLPFSFDSGLAEALMGGWQVGSILTFSTGTPRNHGGCGNYNFGSSGRADVTGINPNINGPAEQFWAGDSDGRQTSYTCDLVADPGLAYRYGNSTRNDLIGPKYANMDFSVNKNFAVTESVGVELRFESYNFTNHPNWNPPSTSFSSTQYGRVTSARAMRINQFALKFNF